MRGALSLLPSCSIVALAALIAGCGSTIQAPASSSATIVPSTTTIEFTSTTAQTFTVSEAGYTGTFTAQSSNTSVATVAIVAPASTTATVHRAATTSGTAQGAFAITPVGGGTATITVSDTNGNTISIPVSVTGATISPQRRS